MKKKLMQKTLAAVLGAAMVFSLAACSADQKGTSEASDSAKTSEAASASATQQQEEDLYYNETGYPICDEMITIKVSGVQGNSPDWNNTLLVKTVEEKLGIHLECEPMAADAFKQQYALMLSTGDIPDLLINAQLDKAQVNKDGEAGFWLDMSQYKDLMPNYYAFLDEYPTLKSYTLTEKGSMYSLSRITASDVSNIYSQIYYDRELVQAAGVDWEIKTVDDFYRALKAVKAAYPDKIPFSLTFDAMPAYRADINLRTAFGIAYNDNSYMLCADDNGDVYLGDITDNNREYLKFLNKLYEEQLLDNNCFVTTKDEYRANEAEGKYIFYCDTGFSMTKADRDAFSAGDYAVKEKYDLIASLTSDITSETTYIANNGVLAKAMVLVNANTEYPEAICRLLDFFATDEGIMLATYGIEGETFEYIDDGYGNKIIDYEKFADLNKYENKGVWKNTEVVIDQGFAWKWAFENAYVDDADEATIQKMASDPACERYWDANVILKVRDAVDNFLVAPAPSVYTEEEATERSTLYSDILSYLVQMKVSFVSGEVDVEDDAEWNKYVDSVKQMGYDRLMQIEQAAWDRKTAN